MKHHNIAKTIVANIDNSNDLILFHEHWLTLVNSELTLVNSELGQKSITLWFISPYTVPQFSYNKLKGNQYKPSYAVDSRMSCVYLVKIEVDNMCQRKGG